MTQGPIKVYQEIKLAKKIWYEKCVLFCVCGVEATHLCKIIKTQHFETTKKVGIFDTWSNFVCG